MEREEQKGMLQNQKAPVQLKKKDAEGKRVRGRTATSCCGFYHQCVHLQASCNLKGWLFLTKRLIQAHDPLHFFILHKSLEISEQTLI